MRRIVEMTNGTFCVQHKTLFWWFFDVTGNGDAEWLLMFDTIEKARKYITGDGMEIKRIVEVFE